MKTQKCLRLAAVLSAFALAVHHVSGTIVRRVPSAPASAFDDVKSCHDLPSVLQQLLAAGLVPDGTPLQTSDLYSVHYPGGSNPNAEDLYATIPSTAYMPTDDRSGAISSSDGWNRDSIIADDGYGEQAHSPHSREGGLPAFCRVGGMVHTSSAGSKAQFEAWLPLPDVPDPNDVRPPRGSGVDTSERHDDLLQKLADVTAEASYKCASTSGWNKRLVFIVGGGLRGAAAYPEMKQTMSRYKVAVAGTNLGHFSASNGTKWIPGNPEGWTDNGHRAVHLSTQIAQLAVSAFYDAKIAPKGDKASVENRHDASEPVFYTYFKGCSTGGRAAMAEVQRYPTDFHGVMAGCPAIDFNHLKAYQAHVNSYLADNTSESYIPPTANPLIHTAVLKSCDAMDGVVDEVVSLPRQCKPDFAKLIGCKSLGLTPLKADKLEKAPTTISRSRVVVSADPKSSLAGSQESGGSEPETRTPILPRDVASGPPETSKPLPIEQVLGTTISNPTGKDKGDSDKVKEDNKEDGRKCLTDEQLETVKNIFTDYVIDGQLIRNAVLPGSELGWTITNAITGKGQASPSSWFHYQVLGDTVWDDKSFNVYKAVTPALIQQGEDKNPGGTITFNPDLSEFFKNGGKLLHYHGLADPLVSPLVSPRYYDMVKKKVGKSIAESYKLYLINGMLHCRGGTGSFNFGGAGQSDQPGERPLRYDSKHDMLLALFDWVERGQAPNSLIGAAYKTDQDGSSSDAKGTTSFANGVRNTRLLCPYPTEARLRHARLANTDDASAFECV
ncbi:uncharacterized protein MEPE_00597 [Melanopsichium pennsylvanicum]|uniref:Carboxylic ester hydrolase n=2 Tax=Melanopsichium pennsylvanicum TaxID=63383 RepID=A0AAJ4XGH5_9BASI|nr:uncharacterized protein BN887_02700 [Melanopsichium pennsylvanicum 4]SNX81892.1 uncharacterized protein MEPE_00597 [Melanopsichium pennsylvanicum]